MGLAGNTSTSKAGLEVEVNQKMEKNQAFYTLKIMFHANLKYRLVGLFVFFKFDKETSPIGPDGRGRYFSKSVTL